MDVMNRRNPTLKRKAWEQIMTNADALMVFYYVVLSGVLVFTLGYFAGHHTKKRQ